MAALKSKNSAKQSKGFSLHITGKTGLTLLAVAVIIGIAGVLGYNKVKYGTFTAQAAWAPTIVCYSGKNLNAYITGSTASNLRVQRYSGGWKLIETARLSKGAAGISIDTSRSTYTYRAQAQYGTTYANTGRVSC